MATNDKRANHIKPSNPQKEKKTYGQLLHTWHAGSEELKAGGGDAVGPVVYTNWHRGTYSTVQSPAPR